MAIRTYTAAPLASGIGGPIPVVKHATSDINGTTATVVSAVTGKQIAVLHLSASANATVTKTTMNDNTTPVWGCVTITGPYAATAPAGGVLFRCSTSQVLNATVTGSANCLINVTYIEEDPV